MDPLLPEPEPLVSLIEALRRLPGVGVRSARRMAYHLLQHDPQGADMLGRALASAVRDLKHCARCNSFSEEEVCGTCSNPKRDRSLLCIVETPADQNMIESSHGYRGLYYVLQGRLSPLDGIGPRELDFDRVIRRATDGDRTLCQRRVVAHLDGGEKAVAIDMDDLALVCAHGHLTR